jgi:hypothetical protein
MYEVTETSVKISRIADKIKDLTIYDDLFDIKEFLEIYENPQAYLEAVIVLISQTNLPVLNKQIISLSMQKLPLTQFLVLISTTSEAVEQQVTDAEVLELMLFPPFNWGAQLAINYENPEVRALLEQIVKMPQLSDNTRTLVDKILTGRAKQDLQQYREMQGYYD